MRYDFLDNIDNTGEKSKKVTVLISVLGNYGRYKKVTYNINGSLYKTNFVLDALSQYYSPDVILLFVPESLLLQIFKNETIIDDVLNFQHDALSLNSYILSKLREINPQISKVIEKKGNILLIPSAGTYDVPGNNIKLYFNNTLLSIEMYAFSLLFEHLGPLLSSRYDLELIFDASHGHNSYVISIMEAIRRFIVMKGIASAKDLIGEKEEIFNIAISSPVIGDRNEKDKIPVYFTQIHVKLFDFLPNYNKIGKRLNNLYEYFEKNDLLDNLSNDKKAKDNKEFSSIYCVSSFIKETYISNYLLNKGALLYLINYIYHSYVLNSRDVLMDFSYFQNIVRYIIKKFNNYSDIRKEDNKIIIKKISSF